MKCNKTESRKIGEREAGGKDDSRVKSAHSLS